MAASGASKLIEDRLSIMEVVPICLVCLKRVENNRDPEYFNEEATHSEKKDIHLIWKFLKLVNQYLRGGVDVGGGDDDNPLFSNLKFEKCSKGNVREADLSELGKLLQGSREATSNKLLTVLIKSVGNQLSSVLEGEVKDSHVKEFRHELELECSKKGKDILPQVSVDRVSLPQAFQEGGGVDRGGTTWPLVLWITQDADESGKTIEGLWNVDVKSEVYDSDDWEDTTYQRPSSSCELLKDKEDSIKLEIEIGHEDECPSDSNGSQLEESRKDKGTCILKCPEPAINILPNTRTRRKARANAVYVATSICEDDENDKIEAQTDKNFDNVNDQRRKDPVTGKGLKLDSNNIDVKCDHCDKVFSSRSRFLDHLRRVERRKTSNCSFHCCFCWRSFFYRQSHEMHMTSTSQSQHKILMKSNAPFLCSDLSCRKWFSSLTEHNEHLKNHSDVINQCPKCGLGFINRSHLELHQLLHTKPTGMSLNSLGRVQCLACSKEFGKMEQFQEHFNTEHGFRLKFDCEKCGIDFKSFLALCVHMKTDLHLPPKVVVPKASAEKKNKKALKKYDYSCEACGKLFTKLHTLQCHLRHFHEYKAKVEEKIFRCCFCVRSFAFSQSCEVHMQEMHKNKIVEKAFQCDVDECKAAFENLDKLKHHLSTHDSSTSNFFECKECKWPFLNSKRLQLHELSHIPRINGVFNCPFPNCKPVFHGVEHFQSHFNIRHGDKLKMFKCLVENCEVACCTMSAIKIHMRSHPEHRSTPRSASSS
ncbi:unnamed protein product [Orchesella dallaii]|uniref:C2H2-type domain-containing protein n=1 Tax=Orchesella dallaii TaxID=48710 RepID=A0ABP1RIU3_9HEXA